MQGGVLGRTLERYSARSQRSFETRCAWSNAVVDMNITKLISPSFTPDNIQIAILAVAVEVFA
ncbi:hypothetical protein BLA17378_07793 [Burkholderia aenigmatica]|uniref:Uncharacterized protein n=1 Tax=Burkholderia aenigmatica TaxID=2015348 RepID=A0ABY6Y533_9BURK|nr:hypothetical protein [Burkholderia aenigmatica]VWD37589.1 hypothetical protein BLA17378_07793 [Burkholderia aenigmatica]